jgi:hypothetical protein
MSGLRELLALLLLLLASDKAGRTLHLILYEDAELSALSAICLSATAFVYLRVLRADEQRLLEVVVLNSLLEGWVL